MKRKRMVSLFLVCGMMFLPVYSAYAENDSMDCSRKYGSKRVIFIQQVRMKILPRS